jgi:hypothetical protein
VALSRATVVPSADSRSVAPRPVKLRPLAGTAFVRHRAMRRLVGHCLTSSRVAAAAAVVFAGSHGLGRQAWAEPPPHPAASPEDAEEELLRDGDVDEDDRPALRLAGRTGTEDLHGESWLSLVGFARQLGSGKSDVGAGVVVAFALDRTAEGPVHVVADAPRQPSLPLSDEAALAAASVAGVARLARDCVLASWRASGIGVDDQAIDSLEGRSRLSAALPETRLRALRLFTDAQHLTLLAASDATNYYDAIGANLALEARFTWRLDRLLYAGDEPTLERLRLERQEARSRLGTRVLEVFFAWQRAGLDEADLPAGSRERRDAALRAVQARATLDVLTGGWFSARLPESTTP